MPSTPLQTPLQSHFNNATFGLYSVSRHTLGAQPSNESNSHLMGVNIKTSRGLQPIVDGQFLPNFMRSALAAPAENSIDLNKSEASATSHLDPDIRALDVAFRDLISCPDEEQKSLFLDAIRHAPNQQKCLNYLISPQKERDFNTVDLHLSHKPSRFELYSFRPAPLYFMFEKQERMGLSGLMEQVIVHFDDIGLPVAVPKKATDSLTRSAHSQLTGRPLTERQRDRNLLTFSAGIHQDHQANIYIGHFDKDGLLDGHGMVINTEKKSTLTGHFVAGALSGPGVFIDDKVRFYGHYQQGRGHGDCLIASLLGESVSVGRVVGGQIQVHKRVIQASDNHANDASEKGKPTAPASKNGAELLTYELGDYVDGTLDLTATYLEDIHRYREQKKSLPKPANPLKAHFIPNDYRKFKMVNGQSVSNKHVLSLPDGSYIGIKQDGAALIHDWSYRNGQFTKEPLKDPIMVSSYLERATADIALEGKKAGDVKNLAKHSAGKAKK